MTAGGMRRIDTIGALIDGGYQLRVYCERGGFDGRCNHSSVIDLEKAAAKLGREHRSMHEDLKDKFKCSSCGSRLVSFKLHPPTATRAGNPYLKNKGQ